LLPWYVVWHRGNQHRLLQVLLEQLRAIPLPMLSDHDRWVPEIDLLPPGP
jgi:hypothetical protein